MCLPFSPHPLCRLLPAQQDFNLQSLSITIIHKNGRFFPPSHFLCKNLREGKQSLSFDVSADLIDCRCKLVHLLYSQLKVFGIANLKINLTWRLMSSARHLGNLQMLLSFLNSGTITSSTQAQKCSDELDVRLFRRYMFINEMLVKWPDTNQAHWGEHLRK